MKLAPLLIILLLLAAPLASAVETIQIPAQTEKSASGASIFRHTADRVYTQKGSETYAISIPNPPFNYSAAANANDSIAIFELQASYFSVVTLDQSTHFEMLFEYNTTQTLKLSYDYTKSGWGIFSTWKRQYTAELNNVIVCQGSGNAAKLQSDLRNLNQPASVVPIVGLLGLISTGADAVSGLLNSVGNTIRVQPLGQFGTNSNLPNTNQTFNPTLGSFTIFDSPSSIGQSCTNPDINTNETLNPQNSFNFSRLTAPAQVTISDSTGQLHSHEINVAVINGTEVPSFSAVVGAAFGNFTNGLTNAFCAGGLLVFTICLGKEIITGMVTFAFSFFNTVLGLVLDLMPGGQTIHALLIFPLRISLDLVSTIFQIYLGAGPNYPPGGTFIALFVVASTFGVGFAGLTGDWNLIYKTPISFLHATTVGIALLFYYVYFLAPKYIVETILNIIKVVRG